MSATPEAQPSPTDDPEIGRVIDGRYKIVAQLGVGGMGAVYRAEHLGMGKQVAVKVLHPHFSGRRDAGARFQREAFAGGRVDHPNCVQVSDFGERDDGSLYLVMELLVGEPLRDVMDREGRIPWPRALHIARHVLRGLGYAHGQGVVHRDVKPENVFVCRHDDDPEFAKVLDFGIAKLIGGDGADATVTQAGMTVGTPTYLSPEQAFGGTIGPASDVYSLSVVLYEMLAGRPPFDDEEPVTLLTAHATRPVPTLAEAAPGLAVPPAVEAIIQRGLGKTTGERFASADDYVAEIDRIRVELEPGRAVTAPPGAPAGGPAPAVTTPPPGFATPPPGLATPPPGLATPPPWDASARVSRATPMPTATPFPVVVRRRRNWVGLAVTCLLTVGVIAAIAAGSGSGAASRMLSPADREAELKAALHDLEHGKTCDDRRQAVLTLRALGDPSAVPALKRARHRMRGGVLGIGDKNTNGCLTDAAAEAIEALGGG
jgi:serine/threonine protein kinase